MATANDGSGTRAPRVFLGRTPEGNRWLLGDDVPQALGRELIRIAQAEPVIPDAEHAPPSGEFRAALGNVEREYRGPAYQLPPIEQLPDHVRPVRPADFAALPDAFAWLRDELAIAGPVHAAFVGGHAVAICHSARSGPRAAEAGVETLPDMRGRGHGRAAVAGWARAVQAEGRLALYSTWWQNAPSRALADALGAIRYGEDFHLT